MPASLFFYDLETTGVNPRDGRVMQFAGQRTDLFLKPVGEPVNELIKLTDEILPEPDAIFITGITPQKTIAEGRTEADFLKLFKSQVAQPGTIFVGFNSVRFDDEFMRFMHYRNFYDAYEWEWKDNRGRWDLLDALRMTRALRPDGIKWPVDSTGKATNRLELMTSLNKLEHADAHDALSDVMATIALARLLRNKQTKLFDYLLSMRDKRDVAKLVNAGQPFVYTSGKYPAEFQKTAVVAKVADHPQQAGAALVYDLRHNPSQYFAMTPDQLADLWRYKKDDPTPRLPVKTMRFNRCPAVAPLGVLDQASQERLQIDLVGVQEHLKLLQQAGAEFVNKLQKAVEILNQEQQTRMLSNPQDVDGQLYDGFVDDADKVTMRAVVAAEPEDLSQFADNLHDQRLKELLPLYKARNFPSQLSNEERGAWEAFRTARLTDGGAGSRLSKYMKRLAELAKTPALTTNQSFLLEELQLYAESIMPDPENQG
jgi:exodeoxyribonuclease-1